MRWFKHLSNTRRSGKIYAVEEKLGEAGYSRALKLQEILAEHGGSGDNFEPRIDLKNPNTSLGWMARELRIRTNSAEKTLQIFAEVGLIDPDEWARRVVYLPEMLELRDEYTRKRAPEMSGHSPESVGTVSHRAEQSRVDQRESRGEGEARGRGGESSGSPLNTEGSPSALSLSALSTSKALPRGKPKDPFEEKMRLATHLASRQKA